jgi:hypothetical protein
MRARALVAVAALLSLLLGGCVSLPEAGSVSTRPGQETVEQGAGTFDYTPDGPRRGAPPLKIVLGFLLAMQSSPQSTTVARKFLTEEARAAWSPDKTTLVYGTRLVTGSRRSFDVSLQQAVRLDDRGTWLGEVGKGVDYTLELTRERGEWRITDPPDALVIPRTYFDSRYQQYFVYFFDPTAQVLVPEPTYLPSGEQAATLLVRRLLQGPHPGLEGVFRTFIPGGTEYVLSVPVSREGVADVALNERILRLSGQDRQMVLAQLAWTLRQVTGVESMRVTANGTPLDFPGAGSSRSVTSWAEFDPSIHWASQELFGVRDGHTVAVEPGSEEATGLFGAEEHTLRDVAVDLAGGRVAGVTDDGTTVVLAPRGRAGGAAPGADQTEVVYDSGSDLLQPAWDLFGQTWLVDRTADGAVVSVVRDGEATRVKAPGIDGEDVKAFVVSRDGTRLVAVVDGNSADRLVVSRVRRGDDYEVRGLTEAVDLPLAEGGGEEIRDLAWRSPGSIAVLTAPSSDSSQVLMALLDGSAALPDVDTTAEVFRGQATRIVASPSPGTPLLLGTAEGELYELGADGQWTEAPIQRPLLAPTFAG